MTAVLSLTPIFRAADNNGNPLFNGTLTTYAAGTTTPQATFVDSTQTTQNTNPIILNQRGECNLWLNPAQTYKFLLQDPFGNPIWTVDNIAPPAALPIDSLNVHYDITPAETAAGATPTNYAELPY